jgi:hypothetical protein
MRLGIWHGLKDKRRITPSMSKKPRVGETIAFDVMQDGNSVRIEGEGIGLDFSVGGIELPPAADVSFAVWALLPFAIGEKFNIHITRPIDPQVATNAERLSRIWQMWVPALYRSITVTGSGTWSRKRQDRLPRVQLYSGGVDSTFAILKHCEPHERSYAATIFGIDYHGPEAMDDFAKLITKTAPLLEQLNYKRIIIHTNATSRPLRLTHAFTLASCLFLLSDLFEEGTIAADQTPVQEMVTHPWSTNHIANKHFAGSDFAMRTLCSEASRIQKLAAISANEMALPFVSVCRQRNVLPANCGICNKCIRTKAMLFAVTGAIPDIFIDRTLSERLVRSWAVQAGEITELFDLYWYAQDRGIVDAIPGLEKLVEDCRRNRMPRVWQKHTGLAKT